jgi:hypothetical protein
VGTPNKRLKVLEVFSVFESHFERLSIHNQVVLVVDKVVVFLCVVNIRDPHDLGILLEDVTTESRLMSDWEIVKSILTQRGLRTGWRLQTRG